MRISHNKGDRRFRMIGIGHHGQTYHRSIIPVERPQVGCSPVAYAPGSPGSLMFANGQFLLDSLA